MALWRRPCRPWRVPPPSTTSAAFAPAAATAFVGAGGGAAAAELDVVVRRGVDGARLPDCRHLHGLEALREDPDRLLLRLGAHHVQRRLLQHAQKTLAPVI